MATQSLEERVATLEAEVAELKERLAASQQKDAVPWWERRFGAFKDDPEYDEAMRLGREYRESTRPAESGAGGNGRRNANGRARHGSPKSHRSRAKRSR